MARFGKLERWIVGVTAALVAIRVFFPVQYVSIRGVRHLVSYWSFVQVEHFSGRYPSTDFPATLLHVIGILALGALAWLMLSLAVLPRTRSGYAPLTLTLFVLGWSIVGSFFVRSAYLTILGIETSNMLLAILIVGLFLMFFATMVAMQAAHDRWMRLEWWEQWPKLARLADVGAMRVYGKPFMEFVRAARAAGGDNVSTEFRDFLVNCGRDIERGEQLDPERERREWRKFIEERSESNPHEPFKPDPEGGDVMKPEIPTGLKRSGSMPPPLGDFKTHEDYEREEGAVERAGEMLDKEQSKDKSQEARPPFREFVRPEDYEYEEQMGARLLKRLEEERKAEQEKRKSPPEPDRPDPGT